MKRLSVLGLVVVVFVGGMALVGPATAAPNDTNASDPTAGGTDFVVTVYENGSARLTQRYTQPLGNQTQVQRFQGYADRFTGEETPVYTDFKQRASGLTSEGSNATGREMQARGFTRSAQVAAQPATTGVVEMSFLWTNFTAETESGPTVGDAFGNGLALSSDMALEFRAGPNLSVEWGSVEPAPDASTNGSVNTTDSLTYFGPAQFASGQPHVDFAANSSSLGGGSPFSTPLALAVAAAVVVFVVLGVAIRYLGVTMFSSTGETDTTTESAGEGEVLMRGGGEAERGLEREPTEPAVTEADLRSDEDHIIALLEANGGRMPQSSIVEETDWSKSKVSALLSEMAEDGSVSKLRIGRENIVSLAGHEPAAARSPFDEG